ncbi:hypothetical protein [Paraburkholderia kirstenboschensis]|nr:hypothetical protein [Paraburkholderia kirstenboschensis]
MLVIYYSHSYRPSENDINEFFQELMLSEGLIPSLDPPSDKLNSAKPERHLRSTDGLIAVLPYRDPEPSDYILYELALCIRAKKPALVFVEDVLPSNTVSDSLLQQRFSRSHYLREVRNHRHALQTLKGYIGSEPPPTFESGIGQRSCLFIGASTLSEVQRHKIERALGLLRYNTIVAPATEDCLSYAKPYESLVARSSLCLSFAENLSPSETYLLGAARSTLTPSVIFSQNPNYAFYKKVPKEYQPKIVSIDDMEGLCERLNEEIGIFQQDYLELKEQEKVLRYRAALIQKSGGSGNYSERVRGDIINIVANHLGVVDMSKDNISVSGVVGPVNIKSKLDNVTQIVKQAPTLGDDRKKEFVGLVEELRVALSEAGDKRPEDTERVAQMTELVAAEVSKANPNKGF